MGGENLLRRHYEVVSLICLGGGRSKRANSVFYDVLSMSVSMPDSKIDALIDFAPLIAFKGCYGETHAIMGYQFRVLANTILGQTLQSLLALPE